MKIICKQRRASGTRVTLDGETYHFKPQSKASDAPHVAEVDNDEHVQRLLAITEGFAPAEGEGEKVEKLVAASNELTELEERAIPKAFSIDELTFEELRAEYKVCYGRAPPPLATHETIAKKVAAYRLQKAVNAPKAKEPVVTDPGADGKDTGESAPPA